MNTPPEITFHISLVTQEAVEIDVAKAWFRCVRGKSPYGVVTTMNQIDDKGQPQTVVMLDRETTQGHYYMVPLTRDLTEREAERIIDAFKDEKPDLDFEVEATVIPTYAMEKGQPSITVDQQKYADIAMAAAKRQHEDWVRARTSEGWRYGQKVSTADKTHPLLRPWDDLPEKFKTVDGDQPQKIVDLLGEHGYVVVSKEDLEAVLRLVRQVS